MRCDRVPVSSAENEKAASNTLQMARSEDRRLRRKGWSYLLANSSACSSASEVSERNGESMFCFGDDDRCRLGVVASNGRLGVFGPKGCLGVVGSNRRLGVVGSVVRENELSAARGDAEGCLFSSMGSPP